MSLGALTSWMFLQGDNVNNALTMLLHGPQCSSGFCPALRQSESFSHFVLEVKGQFKVTQRWHLSCMYMYIFMHLQRLIAYFKAVRGQTPSNIRRFVRCHGMCPCFYVLLCFCKLLSVILTHGLQYVSASTTQNSYEHQGCWLHLVHAAIVTQNIEATGN